MTRHDLNRRLADCVLGHLDETLTRALPGTANIVVLALVNDLADLFVEVSSEVVQDVFRAQHPD